MQGRPIDERAHPGFLAGIGKDVELLLGTIKFSGKTEEFKEERAALGIGRIAPACRPETGLWQSWQNLSLWEPSRPC